MNNLLLYQICLLFEKSSDRTFVVISNIMLSGLFKFAFNKNHLNLKKLFTLYTENNNKI